MLRRLTSARRHFRKQLTSVNSTHEERRPLLSLERDWSAARARASASATMNQGERIYRVRRTVLQMLRDRARRRLHRRRRSRRYGSSIGTAHLLRRARGIALHVASVGPVSGHRRFGTRRSFAAIPRIGARVGTVAGVADRHSLLRPWNAAGTVWVATGARMCLCTFSSFLH